MSPAVGGLRARLSITLMITNAWAAPNECRSFSVRGWRARSLRTTPASLRWSADWRLKPSYVRVRVRARTELNLARDWAGFQASFAYQNDIICVHEVERAVRVSCVSLQSCQLPANWRRVAAIGFKGACQSQPEVHSTMGDKAQMRGVLMLFSLFSVSQLHPARRLSFFMQRAAFTTFPIAAQMQTY